MLKKLTTRALGWLFIVLGIVGLFLPVLQGILFLCLGLLILSTEYVWARRLLQKVRKKFPALARQLDHASQKAASLKLRWSNTPRMAIYCGVGVSVLIVAGIGLCVWVFSN